MYAVLRLSAPASAPQDRPRLARQAAVRVKDANLPAQPFVSPVWYTGLVPPMLEVGDEERRIRNARTRLGSSPCMCLDVNGDWIEQRPTCVPAAWAFLQQRPLPGPRHYRGRRPLRLDRARKVRGAYSTTDRARPAKGGRLQRRDAAWARSTPTPYPTSTTPFRRPRRRGSTATADLPRVVSLCWRQLANCRQPAGRCATRSNASRYQLA